MFSLIASLILLGLGLGALAYARHLKKPEAESAGRGNPYSRGFELSPLVPTAAGAVALVLAAILLIGSVCTVVTAKNAGVLVSFGKVSEKTLAPGLHGKLPWQKVIEIDGTLKTDKYEGDSCIRVRIGDGSEACVGLTNRWNVVETEADRVYQDYKSNDPTESFKDSLISSELMASVQLAMGDYNPVAQFNSADRDASSVDLSFSPDYNAVAKAIEDDMRKKLKERAGDGEALGEIQSITMSSMSLSSTTQTKLDDYVAAIGDTRIAEQKKQTAAAQADANRLLASSVSNDPNVLVSKCMDTLADASDKEYQLPAGFTCWPGGGTGVVIPSASN